MIPRAAKKSREHANTNGTSQFDGEKRTKASGVAAAPTEKLAAEAIAACVSWIMNSCQVAA